MHATMCEDFTITLDVYSPEEHRASSALAFTTVIAAIYGTGTLWQGRESPHLSASIMKTHLAEGFFFLSEHHIHDFVWLSQTNML